ncbi:MULTISPECIES: hypothetical protein [unclassified Halorubrum]|uniref:hypothetical protein n=1 Tax=unclassified Halorubrum TaxID=2642239 RepID=UPI000B99B5F4|nr:MULTISPECIES: hypothetical protein [unclassified Halorubrum]OYR38475.1 hypothetical protein DJ81_17910 [Halorubrum sp. Hd13]OYR44919.1 hypothetical protein DJ74_16985 [Halorubrum sp. Ea8]OYR47286.1 hypothetical protein DJ75_05135 [Halorubrum sp. Eb13]OYR55046.1 hypothetical protein DJ73_02865 [Halorubrum sp. Ea1]
MATLPNTPDLDPEETEEPTVAAEVEADDDPSADVEPGQDGEAAGDTGAETGPDGTIERQIEALIDERVAEIERDMEALEAELEELDDFARISLGERYSQRIEQNVSELSDSLTGFAERNFQKLNSVEGRVDEMSLVLTAVIEALDDADVDVDFSEVRRMQEGVVEEAPAERLAAASRDE